MKRQLLVCSFILIFLFFIGAGVNTFAGKKSKDSPKTLQPIFASKAPVMDGILNDEIWKRPPDVDDDFISYSPTYGEVFPEKTRVWLAYDLENLYFGIYCYDSMPDKIKTSVTKRENMWGDDWIGFNIDTIGTKRYGYVLVVNPYGIQGDLYDSSATGTDIAPDYVWYSAGKLVDDGYTVEITVPLSSIKYSSGKNIKMNIIFERKVSRLGLMASWPQVPPGKGFFAGMAPVVYGELKSQPEFEVIPSVTYSSIWDRESPNKWSSGDDATELGVTAKYSITSAIDGEATLNPDFSQVETDAFQILVNQRYPVFFSEKRPFFMEASKIFSIAGSNMPDKNLIRAVHTRRIVDPGWGLKLNGELQKISFGVLVSNDDWPGKAYDPKIDGPGINPFEGRNTTFGIGRAKYGLGRDNYFGAIFTSRDFADGYNRSFGSDIYLRLGKGNHFFRANYLYSMSKDPSTQKKSNGSTLTASYEFYSRPFDLMTSYEYFDKDFRMDTAFIRRNGISKFTSHVALYFYPDRKKTPWLNRITPYALWYYLHDLFSGDNDYLYNVAIKFNFPKNAHYQLEYQMFKEYWIGQPFKGSFFDTFGGIQLFNWLNLYAYFQVGDGIYYSPTTPLMGKALIFDFQTTIQPNDKISQFFQYYYQKLDRKSNGEKLYDVNILNFNTTYQVNKYLFLRAIFQYDSSLKTLLTDALISYELIPGTVIHLGYGSLQEKLHWSEFNRQWYGYGPMMKYYTTTQSFFFKASYRFRF
jgi:hypothetical protein